MEANTKHRIICMLWQGTVYAAVAHSGVQEWVEVPYIQGIC